MWISWHTTADNSFSSQPGGSASMLQSMEASAPAAANTVLAPFLPPTSSHLSGHRGGVLAVQAFTSTESSRSKFCQCLIWKCLMLGGAGALSEGQKKKANESIAPTDANSNSSFYSSLILLEATMGKPHMHSKIKHAGACEQLYQAMPQAQSTMHHSVSKDTLQTLKWP